MMPSVFNKGKHFAVNVFKDGQERSAMFEKFHVKSLRPSKMFPWKNFAPTMDIVSTKVTLMNASARQASKEAIVKVK